MKTILLLTVLLAMTLTPCAAQIDQQVISQILQNTQTVNNYMPFIVALIIANATLQFLQFAIKRFKRCKCCGGEFSMNNTPDNTPAPPQVSNLEKVIVQK
jgi:secreted trypsin-like serine protease